MDRKATAITEDLTDAKSMLDLRGPDQAIDVHDRAQLVSYTIDAEVERVLVAQAHDVGERLADGSTLVVGRSGTCAAALGRVLEQQVFDGDYGSHSPLLMESEYGPYESASLFMTIVDREGPVGCARLVWSPNIAAPTKTEVDLDLTDGSGRIAHGYSPNDPVWDLATTVVALRGRGTECLGHLVGESLLQTESRRVAPFFAVISVPFFRTLRLVGMPAKALAGLPAKEYLEVLSQPAIFPERPRLSVKTTGPVGKLGRVILARFEHHAQELEPVAEAAEVLLDLTGPAAMPSLVETAAQGES